MQSTRNEERETVVCARVSVYAHALTRGETYEVVEADRARRQVRVRADHGLLRWFPSHCFARPEEPLPVMLDYTIDDTVPDGGATAPVEVTIRFVSGERRWCIFATPRALAACGDWIDGTRLRYHARNRHLILAEQVSGELIDRILRHLDGQGDLVECTLPLFETPDDGET